MKEKESVEIQKAEEERKDVRKKERSQNKNG